MAKKLLDMFDYTDPARAALWAAIHAWKERQKGPDLVLAVEDAAKALGRKRSRACKNEEHGTCKDEKCECRCHYTRRVSRFRPLRGQGEPARAARLARGLCPTHGVVLIPDTVVWEGGKPVADMLKCSRQDCKFTTEANRREGT